MLGALGFCLATFQSAIQIISLLGAGTEPEPNMAADASLSAADHAVLDSDPYSNNPMPVYSSQPPNGTPTAPEAGSVQNAILNLFPALGGRKRTSSTDSDSNGSRTPSPPPAAHGSSHPASPPVSAASPPSGSVGCLTNGLRAESPVSGFTLDSSMLDPSAEPEQVRHGIPTAP